MSSLATQAEGGKPSSRLNGLNDIRFATPAHPPTFAPPTAVSTHGQPSASPEPPNYTFEQYKAANLNIDKQHAIIGRLRSELPVTDRDEIDNVLLRSLAQQLQLAIFPVCKMMQVDPMAVKRMLDEEFQRAYSVDVGREVFERKDSVKDAETQMEMNGLSGRDQGPFNVPAVQKPGPQAGIMPTTLYPQAHLRVEQKPEPLAPESALEPAEPMTTELSTSQIVRTIQDQCDMEPPRKKVKRAEPLSKVQKDIKAYVAKRKRAKRGVRIATIISDSAAMQWEMLGGS